METIVVATSQDNTEEETSSASTPWRPASLTSESKAQNFPNKLHYLLNELEVDGQSHLAYWAKHGRCFFVPNRKEFVEKALCLWFSLTKYTSFQRQLNIYGFKRITSGKDKGAFYHEMFLRGEPSLVNGIPRTQIKGKGPYRSYKGVGNPDFHSMPSLPDVNHEAREQAKRGNEHTSTVDVAPPHGINSASSTELSRPTLSALQRSVESRFLWLQQQRRLQAQMPLLQFPTQPSLYAPPLVLPPTAHVATFIPQSILPMSYRYSAANEGSMPGRLDRQNLLMQVSHPWNQSTLEVQRLQTQCLPSRQEILQALLDAAIP